MKIGEKIKSLRKTRGMSLVQLSKLSGVALATLSRMEHLKMTGTLESHLNIAKALGINITELYSEITAEPKSIAESKAQTEKGVFLHSEKASFEILTNKMFSRKMMPVLIKLEPEGKTATEQASAQAEKFAFVLEGKVELYINNIKYSLSKGESLYFDASLAHYFLNAGKIQSKVLCVVTPPAL